MRLRPPAVTTLAVLLAGCSALPLDSAPLRFAFAYLNGDTSSVPVEPGSEIHAASQPLLLRVRFGTALSSIHEYSALLGPESRASIRDDGAMLLVGGWVFVGGYWPQVVTERVSAGAVGSEMVVQIVGPGERDAHRVFFVSGTEAWSDVGAGRDSWTDPNLFRSITVASGRASITPTLLSEDAEAAAFLESVLVAARDAGI